MFIISVLKFWWLPTTNGLPSYVANRVLPWLWDEEVVSSKLVPSNLENMSYIFPISFWRHIQLSSKNCLGRIFKTYVLHALCSSRPKQSRTFWVPLKLYVSQAPIWKLNGKSVSIRFNEQPSTLLEKMPNQSFWANKKFSFDTVTKILALNLICLFELRQSSSSLLQISWPRAPKT